MTTSTATADKGFRCPACNRLIKASEAAKCTYCQTDSTQWQNLGTIDHLLRFPLPVLVLVIIVLYMQAVLLKFADPDTLTSPPSTVMSLMAVLSLISSLVIIIAVFYLRPRLRERELLRGVKKRRGPGLIALAALSFAGALTLTMVLFVMVWLGFASSIGGQWTLKSLDLVTGQENVLLQGNYRIGQHVASPDGSTIVFALQQDGDWDVFALELGNGSSPKNLTRNEANDVAPSWSADGSEIIFISDQNGQWETLVMDRDGQNPRPADAGKASTDAMVQQANVYRALSIEPSGQTPAILTLVPELDPVIPMIIGFAAGGIFPFIVLSLMLIGVAGYVTRMDREHPRPIFLNDRKMMGVALDAVQQELGVPEEELGVTSFKRTDEGGLQMVVRRTFKTKEENSLTGESKDVTKHRSFDVATDEWARITSLEQQDPRTARRP